MSTDLLLPSLFRYKAWAGDALLACLARIDAQVHAAERHTAMRIANHIHIVDRLFEAQLQRLPLPFAATNTPDTPTLDALHDAVRTTDAWYLRFVEDQPPQALAERLHFVFTDGEAGCMSRAEMLMHVIAHGTYHRGAIGRILQQLGIAPPRDLFTGFLHASEPERRAAV
ncbi:damage-inducible protein DinB [Aquincola sp. S2]|uniref:Damage-inducible protein DinB n=1 Tax=Pseudaquabacterium terrae TaxID=2732868 RepID=A0ABX2EKP7_9BURK|nr:DinB family protein [Aquabacterium terrae]NRF69212.1 damage-inducible protein DinB [Aquabacterium terrae]